jgi:hypothetical protein
VCASRRRRVGIGARRASAGAGGVRHELPSTDAGQGLRQRRHCQRQARWNGVARDTAAGYLSRIRRYSSLGSTSTDGRITSSGSAGALSTWRRSSCFSTCSPSDRLPGTSQRRWRRACPCLLVLRHRPRTSSRHLPHLRRSRGLRARRHESRCLGVRVITLHYPVARSPRGRGLIITIGLFAAVGPARRAVRVDPTEALRDG